MSKELVQSSQQDNTPETVHNRRYNRIGNIGLVAAGVGMPLVENIVSYAAHRDGDPVSFGIGIGVVAITKLLQQLRRGRYENDRSELGESSTDDTDEQRVYDSYIQSQRSERDTFIDERLNFVTQIIGVSTDDFKRIKPVIGNALFNGDTNEHPDVTYIRGNMRLIVKAIICTVKNPDEYWQTTLRDQAGALAGMHDETLRAQDKKAKIASQFLHSHLSAHERNFYENETGTLNRRLSELADDEESQTISMFKDFLKYTNLQEFEAKLAAFIEEFDIVYSRTTDKEIEHDKFDAVTGFRRAIIDDTLAPIKELIETPDELDTADKLLDLFVTIPNQSMTGIQVRRYYERFAALKARLSNSEVLDWESFKVRYLLGPEIKAITA